MPDGAGPAEKIFDVFVSYAREDADKLASVLNFLESRGYSVDWDKRLTAGKDWQDQLRLKIKRARKVVALWSASASASEVVSWEIGVAHGDDKLIPLWLDETDPKSIFAKLVSSRSRISGARRRPYSTRSAPGRARARRS